MRYDIMEETQELSEVPVETTEEIEQLPELPPSLDHSPADTAAVFFKRYQKELVARLQTMSLRQVKRVIMAVGSHPFNGAYSPKDKNEERVAYLFNEMVYNKTIMILDFEKQRIETTKKEELEQIENTVYDSENVTRPKEKDYIEYQQKLQIEKEENNG